MPAKTKVNIDIEIVGKDKTTRGRLSLSSGNIYYYRINAQNVTAQYTYQQLVDLIERDLCKEDE